MTADRLRDLLLGGAELRALECKGDVCFDDKAIQAKVARAVLGLANHRDGGHVVVGVEETRDAEDRPVLRPVGVRAEWRRSWAPDTVRTRLAEFADPHVDVDVTVVDLEDCACVVLHVHEFSETPVVCRRDAQDPATNKPLIKRGRMYVRSRGKPESVEVPSSAEMRDVLDLAVEKRLRAFLGTATRAGLDLAGAADAARQAGYDAEWAAFAAPGSGIVRKVRSRGHWTVRIHPERYQAARVTDIAELERIARQSEVSLRGWNFPAFVGHVARGDRWVGQEHALEHHVEAFRYYDSGQFVFVGGLAYDWRDESTSWRAEPGWAPGQRLHVGDAVLRAVEVYELAARLAASALGDERMVVRVAVGGLAGRTLRLDLPNRVPLRLDYTADLATFERTDTFAREALAGDPVAPALAFTLDLFRRFHWDTDAGLLQGIWRQLERGG